MVKHPVERVVSDISDFGVISSLYFNKTGIMDKYRNNVSNCTGVKLENSVKNPYGFSDIIAKWILTSVINS